MKNSWKKWEIGNPLRGYFYFKARTIEEAWEKGCKIFNQAYPSKKGRQICLELNDDTLVPTTKFTIEQMKLPPDKRCFINQSYPTRGYVTVACGCSKEKLIFNYDADEKFKVKNKKK